MTITTNYRKASMTRTVTLGADGLVTVVTERETYRTTLSAWAYDISRSWEEYGWTRQ
jgi:hypothetical protein